MSRRALITGVSGQDGAYLAQRLLEEGYDVYGGYRRSTGRMFWRLEELGIEDEVHLVPLEVLEITNIMRVLEDIEPDEIYHLAAQSFVGLSFEQPIATADIDAMGTLRMLEAVRTIVPNAKFYQASSSEMFGKARSALQNEDTPFHPRSPYGISKVFGHGATVNYREAYDMFCVSGILFNHESPLRGSEFVTRKISRGVANIKLGLQEKLSLGNLEAKRDWGYAPDYVDAMYRIMQHDSPDDYVVATGENHTVREFVNRAFEVADFEIAWEGEGIAERGVDRSSGKPLVDINPEFYRPAEVNSLLGDASKAHTKLGWAPQTTFDELVEAMVVADLERLHHSKIRSV